MGIIVGRDGRYGDVLSLKSLFLSLWLTPVGLCETTLGLAGRHLLLFRWTLVIGSERPSLDERKIVFTTGTAGAALFFDLGPISARFFASAGLGWKT